MNSTSTVGILWVEAGMVMTQKGVRIVPTVERFPNYVFHLLAVAKINYDSEYGDTYSDTIDPDDLNFLKTNRELLAFPDGHCSDLTTLFVFLPCYIGFESNEAACEYFNVLMKAAETGDGSVLIERYKEPVERLKRWTDRDLGLIHQLCRQLSDAHRAEAIRLAGIFTGSYSRYCDEVWPVESQKLEQAAKALENRLAEVGSDIINRWEAITERRFAFPEYQICLCAANKNGPDANSLGYERNLFWGFSDLDALVNFISHETGTHLLIDEFLDTWSEKNENIAYQAYESLCEFYNRQVTGGGIISYAETPDLLRIYGEITERKRDVAPRELLKQGIEIYLKRGS